jgi:putative transcriptional regulator
LLRAKRTIEAVVENGEAVVHLPTVEHVTKLARELRSAGFIVSRLASTHVDVRVVREKLGLTQEQFALRKIGSRGAISRTRRRSRIYA